MSIAIGCTIAITIAIVLLIIIAIVAMLITIMSTYIMYRYAHIRVAVFGWGSLATDGTLPRTWLPLWKPWPPAGLPV